MADRNGMTPPTGFSWWWLNDPAKPNVDENPICYKDSVYNLRSSESHFVTPNTLLSFVVAGPQQPSYVRSEAYAPSTADAHDGVGLVNDYSGAVRRDERMKSSSVVISVTFDGSAKVDSDDLTMDSQDMSEATQCYLLWLVRCVKRLDPVNGVPRRVQRAALGRRYAEWHSRLPLPQLSDHGRDGPAPPGDRARGWQQHRISGRRLRGVVPRSHRWQHVGAETLRHGSVLVAPTHPAVDQPQMRSTARTRYVLDATHEVLCRPAGKLGVRRRLFDLGHRDRVFARCLPRQHGDHEECASGWKKLVVCEHAAPHEGPGTPVTDRSGRSPPSCPTSVVADQLFLR